MQDPYSILGVSKSATQDEIKKAYRKLAKANHPDLHPGNKEKEKKFKEISHAFDLIGTAEARAAFEKGDDEKRAYEEYQRNASYYDGAQDFGGFNPNEIFENLFGGGSRRSGPQPGQDELYKLEVEFKEAALGGEKLITLPSGKKLKVTIPAGLVEGQKLRFKGQGGPGSKGGPNGDVYVEMHVKSLQGFTRNGNDIETEVPVSFFEAVTGAEISVPTLEGNVMLKIPAGVSTGSKLRIKGKGAGKGDSRGHQIVVLKVVTPKNVPAGLKEALSSLKEQYDYHPRSA